jgi:LysM repeat protein
MAKKELGPLPPHGCQSRRHVNSIESTVAATSRLFSELLSASCVVMWKRLFVAGLLAVTASALRAQSQIEIANLREDVRGLVQRVGELNLRVEQLERENAELRQRVSSAGQAYASVADLEAAVAELNRSIRAASAAAKNEALQQVSVQMEALARQTNTALESLAKTQGARPVATPGFSENYPKEGISYTVQKGDSIAVIARKTGAKAQDIINANKISDPSRIVVGQTLFIPGGK